MDRNRNTICIFNVLAILKNNNPLMWSELFGSRAFMHEEELHKALSTTTSAGLVQSVKTNGHHLFSITPKGRIFLETFASGWQVFKVRRETRRHIIF